MNLIIYFSSVSIKTGFQIKYDMSLEGSVGFVLRFVGKESHQTSYIKITDKIYDIPGYDIILDDGTSIILDGNMNIYTAICWWF